MLARCPVICSHYGALSKRDRWHLTSDLWPGQPVICLKNSAHVSDNIFRAWTTMLKWNIQMNRNRRSVVSSNQFIRHRPNLVYLSILSRVPRYCATFIFAIFLVSTDRFNIFSQLQEVMISAHIWNKSSTSPYTNVFLHYLIKYCALHISISYIYVFLPRDAMRKRGLCCRPVAYFHFIPGQPCVQ